MKKIMLALSISCLSGAAMAACPTLDKSVINQVIPGQFITIDGKRWMPTIPNLSSDPDVRERQIIVYLAALSKFASKGTITVDEKPASELGGHSCLYSGPPDNYAKLLLIEEGSTLPKASE